MKIRFIPLILVISTSVLAEAKSPGSLDPAKIEQLTGLKGQMNDAQGVFKVSYPRTDIKATVDGVKMTPPMGLTAWVAFKKIGNHVAVMGDTVLTEDQVNPVMSVALENGLEVTALHNHFFADSPRVMFMHIGGMGDEEKLARAVGQVYAKVKETAAKPVPFVKVALDPSETKLSPAPLDKALGTHGTLKDGVYKVSIGRITQMAGHEMGEAMGVNTWAAFIGTDAKSVVDGDFAMLEGELQEVLKTLRSAGINIVAIHNHMTQENPRIVFLHYWGVGPAVKLAQGLRAALDKQAK